MPPLHVKVAALALLLALITGVCAVEPCFPSLGGPPTKVFPPCEVRTSDNHATGPNNTNITVSFYRPFCMSSCVVETYEHGSKTKLPPPASGVLTPQSSMWVTTPFKQVETLDVDKYWCTSVALPDQVDMNGYRWLRFFATGLKPGHKYDFSVYCRNDNPKVGPKLVTPRVNVAATADVGNICTWLGPVINIRKLSSTRQGSQANVTITWDPPKEVPGRCLGGYCILYQDAGKNPPEDFNLGGGCIGNITKYTATYKIEAGKSYEFMVTAVNGDNFGPGVVSKPIQA